MDNKLIKNLRKKVKNYESSKEYQDYCWKVYHKNEDFIKQLIKWRTILNIKPGSTGDKAIAFFIHRLWQKHSFKWKIILRRMMMSVLAHPPGMYSTFLSIYMNRYEMSMLKDIIAGNEDKYYVSRDRIHSKEKLSKRLQLLEDYDKKYATKFLKEGKIVPLSSPEIEFLPEWYFIARPTNKFYQDKNLEAIIQPLIEREIAEDNIKLKYVNKLNELFQKHAFQTTHLKKALNYLKGIGKFILLEIKFRKELKEEKDLNKVKTIENKIKKNIIAQKLVLKEIEEKLTKGTIVPNKEIHEKVTSLMDKLKSTIKKELK